MPRTSTLATRQSIIDDMKRRHHVAYFIEMTFGAMVGQLLCRQCFDKHLVLADGAVPLGLMEACALGIREGQAPMCDGCGHDIRESR